MDLKPTHVKINKCTDTTVLDHSDKLDYDPLLTDHSQSGGDMPPNITRKLLNDISDLKQDDHIMIYKMLRSNKGA